MKKIVYIRSVFDVASRKISRHLAARLLRTHRNHSLRGGDFGWKFINGFEPTIISYSPIDHNVNF